jgi:3-methyladenine DNA glycosylase/8-oxoguanine DNA glycosylase
MRSREKVLNDIDRLLELPQLIEKVGRQLVAQRAEKRNLERRVKAREAAMRVELMGWDEYRDCSNADERSAVIENATHTDPNWEGLQERLEQLTVAIEKSQLEKEVLDHERKALKAGLEREYADIIEQALSDRALASVVGRGVQA